MSNLSPFRFWCRKVLPLVYDDNLSIHELLCKMVEYINSLIKDSQELAEACDDIDRPFETDTTLTIEGMAADAKATGEAIAEEATTAANNLNTVRSALEGSILSNSNSIAAETRNREAADSQIITELNTKANAEEVTALEGSILSNSNSIAAETRNREAADSQIITELNTKANAEEVAAELSEKISKTEWRYQRGETAIIARVYCVAYIDNTNKLHFFVPLSKEKIESSPNVTTINIDTLYLIHAGEVVNGLTYITGKNGYTRINGVDLELTVSGKPGNIAYYEPLVVDYRGSIVF